MRSQLDCIDDSLPGTGVFDLKTRAISAIRHDVHNYMNYLDVGLATLTGRRGSFEEEYFDMIRAAFLEYSFQVRIGNMDGIFVAYHNTARIFGFQYVSLDEMDQCLFGTAGAGKPVFERCIWIMEMLYQEITKCFPKKVGSRSTSREANLIIDFALVVGYEHVREARKAPLCVGRTRGQSQPQGRATCRRAPAVPHEHRKRQADQRRGRGRDRYSLCVSASVSIAACCHC